tara:strand:- start:99 stop:971 length:873 start_codon:yes stop_codon:yes gene_type:complete
MGLDVKIPRFFVNMHEYLHRIGKANYGNKQDIISTLPVLANPTTFTDGKSTFGNLDGGKNFLAILNYDASEDINGNIVAFKVNNTVPTTLVGGEGDSGFRIGTFTGNPANVAITGKGGSIILGSYWDMDFSADLSLSLEYDYSSNTNTMTSYNGSEYSNTIGTPNTWGDRAAWEQATSDFSRTAIGRKARRIWNLKFSTLDSRGLLGENTLHNSVATNDTHTYNIVNDLSFYARVWTRTLGGQIPFIFQADNTNNSPDQFAICKIQSNSLTVEQTSPSVYSVSMIIEEVY